MSLRQDGIRAEMTILDVVSRYRQTEAVFTKYDEKAGVCLCCEALFDPLQEIAERYGLNLEKLLADLNSAVKGDSG
jgi:hypothetical protein